MNFIESVAGPEQGFWCCFADITNWRRLHLQAKQATVRPVLRGPHIKRANCVQVAKQVTPKLLSPYPLYTIRIKPTPLNLMNIAAMCLLNTGFHHTCMLIRVKDFLNRFYFLVKHALTVILQKCKHFFSFLCVCARQKGGITVPGIPSGDLGNWG